MILYFYLLLNIVLLNSQGNSLPEGNERSGIKECDFDNNAFRGGEILVYKAYYNWGLLWIPAGEAVFKVDENNTHYQIEVEGSSYPAYDSFFKLRDKFYTRIDKQTLLPEVFERRVKEDDYLKYERIEFNQNKGSAISFIGKSIDKTEAVNHNFEDCIQDLLSLLYSLRSVDVDSYKKGAVLNQNLLFDGEIFNLDIRYEGKSEITVRNQGNFKAIKVVPDLISGHVFKDGDFMEVWVTDDENKIPLIVESPLKIGSLKAILKSYDGVRNHLKSKLE